MLPAFLSFFVLSSWPSPWLFLPVALFCCEAAVTVAPVGLFFQSLASCRVCVYVYVLVELRTILNRYLSLQPRTPKRVCAGEKTNSTQRFALQTKILLRAKIPLLPWMHQINSVLSPCLFLLYNGLWGGKRKIGVKCIVHGTEKV